jgi:hypothetical protein
MDILVAIKREERRLVKQLAKIEHQLTGVRNAAKALGHSAAKKMTRSTKSVLSDKRVSDILVANI